MSILKRGGMQDLNQFKNLNKIQKEIGSLLKWVKLHFLKYLCHRKMNLHYILLQINRQINQRIFSIRTSPRFPLQFYNKREGKVNKTLCQKSSQKNMVMMQVKNNIICHLQKTLISQIYNNWTSKDSHHNFYYDPKKNLALELQGIHNC